MTPLTVASFFSGVGLLDLGLEWAGWRTVSVSEVNPYANRILALRYPDAPNLGDLHDITDVPPATLWAGGFPCQPVSHIGSKRAQDDERWLWPVWVRLIRDLRPPYLLLENVANLLAVNDGRAFGDVVGSLAEVGYDAEWDCLPASALGAPHERDRVWIVGWDADSGHVPPVKAVPHEVSKSRRGSGGRWWRTEPGMGRVADGVPNRVDRLRCLGNGVVPQVAEFIGHRLREVIEAQDMDRAA